MTDRELWVSVFNTALQSAVNFQALDTIENPKGFVWDGKTVTASSWAKAIADQALKDAPEGHP